MNDQLLQPISDVTAYTPASGGSSLFREKLMKKFSAVDFVRVINPDDQEFIWQYLPAEKETITFDSSQSTVPMKFVDRQEPEVYRIDPGQTAIIPGASAYIMIEGLVKRLMAKRTIARNPSAAPGQARNFSFSDDVAQEELLNEIYLGKNLPAFEAIPTKTSDPASTNVDDDLGLTNEPAPRVGRPRKSE